MHNSFMEREKPLPNIKWKLQVRFQDGERIVPLSNTDVTIGRSSEADIAIDDNRASRQHAKLYFDNGSWWVQDLESSNGTFIEGHKVNNAKVIGGSHFKIGSTLFTILSEETTLNSRMIEKTPDIKFTKMKFFAILLAVSLMIGLAFALLSKRDASDGSVKIVDPSMGIGSVASPPLDQTLPPETANNEDIPSFSERLIVKQEVEDDNKMKTKELYRAGLLFYDNGNLKKAIDQWDLALTYDNNNILVINKLAKAVEELDYLISEHYKNGKMHIKYSRLSQAENDFTIVVELAREKQDSRYLDALEQLEMIRKK